MKKCCWGSVVEKCCGELLWRSVVGALSVVGEVLWEKCCGRSNVGEVYLEKCCG